MLNLLRSGEGGILDQFVQDSYPLYMCLILQIIRSTMGYRGKLSAFSPSQSSHTILSVSHRCNFFMAKMHQKHPYLHAYNLLITNKIIIILPILTFSLECIFSIFIIVMLCYSVNLHIFIPINRELEVIPQYESFC